MLGTCWVPYDRQAALIWISPTNHGTDREGLVDTFIHELTHAYTRTSHGWTWRRMFALLQPHLTVLFEVETRDWKIGQTIKRYQRKHATERITAGYYETYDRWDRKDEEKAKHALAVARMNDRLARLGVTP